MVNILSFTPSTSELKVILTPKVFFNRVELDPPFPIIIPAILE